MTQTQLFTPAATGQVASMTTTITPYRDGPLLIRGDYTIEDQEGRPIELGREVVALCRCGKSRIRPFCDGSHKLVGFTAPSEREQRG